MTPLNGIEKGRARLPRRVLLFGTHGVGKSTWGAMADKPIFVPTEDGLGDIDWSRWISALTDAGYNGPVCVEVEDDAFTESLETRKQSLRISRNVLRPLIG